MEEDSAVTAVRKAIEASFWYGIFLGLLSGFVVGGFILSYLIMWK